MSKSEYSKAGVDYTLMEPFKQAMIATGKRTVTFPNKRDVYINQDVMHAHGAVYEYRGSKSHMFCQTQEDLGNKNWIAEWMYQNIGNQKIENGKQNRTFYEGIGIDTALMVVNDVIAQGAMPVVFTDQVEVGDSAWFADEKRSKALAESFYNICEEVGMALPAGESATLKYLIKSEGPVKIAPTLSGAVTGIIAPKEKLITGKDLQVGDHIIAVASSGVHSNGISLIIKKALDLPEQFLTKLPSGMTFGESALIPTRSYVKLIESLQEAEVKIHALLPGTGDGVGKLSFDKRPMTYRIHSWLAVPELMLYFKNNGLPMLDCLKTFNWGAGYYIFAPKDQVDTILKIGAGAGYTLADVGAVESGIRQTIFEPENIVLPPPGH
jgi:phosphoribosylformylglycinamidine cyclo-ligase